MLASKDIPRNPLENLEYRAELNRWVEAELHLREARRATIRKACANDITFWLNSFAFLLEPRILGNESTSSKIPFCSWPHQDEALLEMQLWLGRKDMVISKSRAEGASWLVLMLFLHKWLYRENSRFGVVSKNEDTAASLEDTDSLLYKLDWQVQQLPPWLRPERWRTVPSENTISNYSNGSAITAYACTGDVGVGGRKLAIMFDELSRWESGKDYTAWVSNQAVSPCRIAVGTPFGPSGQYYDLVHDEDSDILKVRLNWKKNPTKNRGMYRVVEGKPMLVDLRNPWQNDYGNRVHEVLKKLIRKGYNVEEGLRSEWYDGECLRSGATPQSIAQEYDESFTGSSTPYFGDFLLRRLKTESVRPSYKRGSLSYDPETLVPTFREDENGDLFLWCNLLVDKTPPFGKYALGCDVSFGTGGAYSSLSVICVFDATTGEQVAEFATRVMRPDKFADFAIAMAKWFHDGKLNWEAPGPGVQFTNQVVYRGYGHCFRRKVKEELSSKQTKKLGVHIQGDDKVQLFGGGGSGYEGFYGAVVDGKAIPRSEKLVEECGEYLYKKRNGKLIVVHKSDAIKNAGTDEHGKDHGDRVVAAAIAWMTTQDMGKLDEEKVSPVEKAPVGSWAWRQQQAKREELELVSELDFE